MSRSGDLMEELIGCGSDQKKWLWCLDHREEFGQGQWQLKVVCDNDMTWVETKNPMYDPSNPESEEILTVNFNGYIGWSDGVMAMLEGIGIYAEVA